MARYLIYAAFCAALLCEKPQPASSAAPSGQNHKAYQRDKDGALVPRMNYATFLDRSYRFVLHDLDNGWASGNAYRDRDGKPVPGYVNYALVNPRRQLGVGHPLNADTVYPAFHHALFIRTLLARWRRTGDAECLARARQLADWNLQRRTPADCLYGSLFYSTVHKGIVGGNIDGDTLMTDKPAIMALAMLELAQATGEKSYREAAEAVANTLAKTQLPEGNWPFRVNPQTGAVREAYTSSAIYAVMLFETLGPGRDNCWAKARAKTLKWILDGPVKTMRWNGFYEDIGPETGKENRTNWDCIDTARWLVAHRGENAEYLPLAIKLHDWIAKEFVEKNTAWAPAEGLREQKCCFQTMGIHTAHWAALLADLHAATGNVTFKRRVLDSCALVTYWMRDDGANLVGPTWGDEIWFSCHFGAALYLQDALSRFPELLGPEKQAAAALEPSGVLPLPGDCPFDRSPEFSGIELTGRHVQYGNADTWYPSWASDGNLYSPWTDGYLLKGTEGRQQMPFDEKHPADACNSVDFLGRKAATAQAKIVGDDPLHLKIINLATRIDASPKPYEGRYPCGSLVHNDVWYYGTYALTNNKRSDCGGVGWTLLGPFVGFRWSTDFGKTWTETPCTPARPLFGEDPKRAPVKIGSPHFVDLGRNMEHSPDGYAYLVAHGSTRAEAWNNWIQGDQVYLLRVKPSIQAMNDAAAYEFFAGRDAGGKPTWTRNFAAIKPLLEWNDNLGCVTATYNAGLKKYLMCVSRSVRVQHANALYLESSDLTGPWKVIAYLKDFGPENYFLNIPSKFISQDGKTVWLCHSGNWAGHVETGGNPPGSHYALCLREFRLVSRTEEKGASPRLLVPPQHGPENYIAGPTSDPGEGYGLRRCALAGLAEAVARSRAGIYACTLDSRTHIADVKAAWGKGSWLNDLYFGLHGGMYVADDRQHDVFRAELRKIAATMRPGQEQVAPYFVSSNGKQSRFNLPGMDLDRHCQFVLSVLRAWEATGDDAFARELLPACRACVDAVRRRDLDGDHLPEGRSLKPARVQGVGSCGSCAYIGDTARNDWKDFGVSLFFWEALEGLAVLERNAGDREAADRLRAEAVEVRTAAQRAFWNRRSGGYLAWIDANGQPHDDWITGSNMHAVASGFADSERAREILATLNAHRREIEEDKPGRVRIGVFADGLCSNKPETYWNGGAWPLVAAPILRGRARMGDLTGAVRLADRLANHTPITAHGFFEAYELNGKPNQCEGLLMNNGGFLWGVFSGVLGVDFHGDRLMIRSQIAPGIAPAEAIFRWRGSDVRIRWQNAPGPASCGGKRLTSAGGFYCIAADVGCDRVEIVIPADGA